MMDVPHSKHMLTLMVPLFFFHSCFWHLFRNS